MKKIFLLGMVALMSVAAQAQIVSSRSERITVQREVTPATNVNELSAYLGNGWGVGYQFRHDFNKYVGWNVFGLSYMSGFDYSPADGGTFNLRALGVRGYTPSYKGIVRGYADLNMGYTLTYFYNDWYEEMYCDHHFGLDFGFGVQLYKHFAVGYNVTIARPGYGASHFAKLSYLF